MSQIAENQEVTDGFDAGADDGLYGDHAITAFESLYDGEEENDVGQNDAADGAEDDNVAGQEETVPEQPDLPMPEGWEAAMWQAMAPEMRGKVDAMVKAHADTVSKHAGELSALKTQTAQTLHKANAEAQKLLDFAREVIEGELRNVDWQALRQQPELYMQAQDLFHSRRLALAELQQQIDANRQATERAGMEQAKSFIASEWAATEPKLKALVGADYNRDGYKATMRDYLKKAGASDAEISSIGRGYMLEIATKAMLFDKNMEARKAASAKVAEAPKVQAPRGAGSAEDGDAYAKARARLSRNPNSLEAQVGLFEALY